MIEIKRFPSGQFLAFLERDILKRKTEDLEPENMLDGKLGFMWLIFGTCRRDREIQWSNHKYERNRVVKTTLAKADYRWSSLIKGKDVEEKIEFYHKMLDEEAKRRGGVVLDVHHPQ